VAETRLHNDSKVIIIMTRWHEVDLAGRLLKEEPGEWEVVSFPAIKDEVNAIDPRKLGEALWPQRHSLKRLRKKEKKSAWVFTALYQQRPAPIGGGLIKGAWFRRFPLAAMPPGPVRFYVDTAYTKKTENDETAILAYKVWKGRIYIIHSAAVRKEFHELVVWLPLYVAAAGYTPQSVIKIEPKASGLSVIQELGDKTDLNVEAAANPEGDKVTRVTVMGPTLSTGHVYMMDPPEGDAGDWQAAFTAQCEAFPNGAHDDRVDTLEGAVRNDLIMEAWNTISKTN
jgi:predicted phage terminase large subunit-like protein